MSLRTHWSGSWLRHPTAARIVVVFASVLVVAYGWPLGNILLRLYFPEPGRYCGTPEVMALLVGAVIVAPAALLLAAAQVSIRGALPERTLWRPLSYTALVALPLLVVANWIAFIKLVWL